MSPNPPGILPPPAGIGADLAVRHWWRELGPIVQFAIIYEQRGVTNAAIHLGVVKSSVSEALARLERLRGELLMDHVTWQPTAAGEDFYRHTAKPLLDVVRSCGLENIGGGPLLRLGASEYIIQEYLTKILQVFRQLVPDLRVELHSGNRAELQAKLANTIDLAIMAVDTPDPSYVAHELLERRVTLLVPRRTKAKTAEQYLAQTPLPHALAIPPAAEGTTQLFLNYLAKLGVDWPVQTQASRTALIPFIVGGGDCAGPCVHVQSLIEQQGVRALLLPDVPPLKVVALSRGAPSALLQKLLASIREVALRLAIDDM